MDQLSEKVEGSSGANVIQQLAIDIKNLMNTVQFVWKKAMDARIPESDVIQYVQAHYEEMSKNFSLSWINTCNWLLGSDGKKLLESIFIERSGELVIMGPKEEEEVMSKKYLIIYEVALIERLLREWIPFVRSWSTHQNHRAQNIAGHVVMKDNFTPAHISLLRQLGIKMEIALSENKERQVKLYLN